MKESFRRLFETVIKEEKDDKGGSPDVNRNIDDYKFNEVIDGLGKPKNYKMMNGDSDIEINSKNDGKLMEANGFPVRAKFPGNNTNTFWDDKGTMTSELNPANMNAARHVAKTIAEPLTPEYTEKGFYKPEPGKLGSIRAADPAAGIEKFTLIDNVGGKMQTGLVSKSDNPEDLKPGEWSKPIPKPASKKDKFSTAVRNMQSAGATGVGHAMQSNIDNKKSDMISGAGIAGAAILPAAAIAIYRKFFKKEADKCNGDAACIADAKSKVKSVMMKKFGKQESVEEEFNLEDLEEAWNFEKGKDKEDKSNESDDKDDDKKKDNKPPWLKGKDEDDKDDDGSDDKDDDKKEDDKDDKKDSKPPWLKNKKVVEAVTKWYNKKVNVTEAVEESLSKQMYNVIKKKYK